ncbi:MAG: Ig-like domain-containing protein, partial [Thiohalomonadales bacterium]
MFHRMTRLAVTTLIITTTLFGLQACGGGDSTTAPINKDPASGTKDKIAPTVTTSNLGTVDYTQAIIIKFSEAIVVTDADVVLHQMQTSGMVTVPTSVTVSGSSLTITPSTATVTTPLLPATDYHLILKNTITDLAKNALIKKELSFTTATEGTGGNGGGNGGNPGGGNTTKTITFIELNDLHANLVPHSEMIRQTGAASGKKVLISERGGLVRIAAKINEIRMANPQSSVLMNIGDTYHGGAEAMFSIGNAIVKPVNALGIDVAVPGNWDFAYGPQVTNFRFGKLVDEAQVLRPTFIVLGANVKYKTPIFDVTQTADYNDPATSVIFKRGMFSAIDNLKKNINIKDPITGEQFAENDPFLPSTTIKTINGIKVGFIGITSDIVKLMHPMMALNLKFTQGKADYLLLLNGLAKALKNSDKVDLVVVMSELGIQKDIALADSISQDANNRPLVDIFFSAHTHELVASDKQITSKSGSLVVEAGNDTYLGQLDVTFDSNNAPTNFKWTIHPIDSSITPDTTIPYIKTIQLLVNEARVPYLNVTTPISIPQVTLAGGPSGGNNFVTPQKLSQSIDVTVGSTKVILDRKNALESNFNNAYTDILRNVQGTDVAVTPGFRFDSSIVPAPAATDYWEVENNVTLTGKITIADVYRFMPAAYFLANGTTTIENVKRVLEG